jgi:hypothetical protein
VANFHAGSGVTGTSNSIGCTATSFEPSALQPGDELVVGVHARSLIGRCRPGGRHPGVLGERAEQRAVWAVPRTALGALALFLGIVVALWRARRKIRALRSGPNVSQCSS